MMKKIRGENEGGESSSSTTLPDEILYEILTRVTLDDLLQSCRKVCREWQTLTYNSTFRSLHSRRTRSVSGYIVQLVTNNRSQICFVSASFSKYTTDISRKFPWIKAATYQAQGLVCCLRKLDSRTHRYYVCKPLTRQGREIPNPKSGCYNEKMAIMIMKSNPLHYKIIRFSESIEEWGLKYCEIFDSKNWAWKIHSKFRRLPQFDFEPELLLDGSFYWLTFSEQIFVFDLVHENWRFIMLPQLQSSSALEDGEEVENMKYDKKLVDCEGKIGVLHSPRLGKGKGSLWIELWVMEDYLKESWNKKYRVSLEPLNQLPQPCSILAIDNITNSILVRVFNRIIWYDFITGAYTRVKKLKNPITTLVHSIHPFNSDFVPCDSLDQEDDPEEEEADRSQ